MAYDNMSENNLLETIIGMRTGIIKPEHENLYWSEFDNTVLISNFNNGIGISELAVLLNRSEQAVYQRLRALGFFEIYCKHRHREKKMEEKCMYDENSCLCNHCKLIYTDKCSRYSSQYNNE